MALTKANDTLHLAGQAASLSSELHVLQKECQHQTTAEEISTIADELARLSTTLSQLNDCINADPEHYTDAFNEDLSEITTELASVFEEISECCKGLQVADSSISTVSWFFKKGRVTRLLKHLEALKGTLMVMRTVLFHGKDYGTHRSDRIAESSPHTMHEDRVILESVLARNREAILELHTLTNTMSNPPVQSLKRKASRAGDHHRQLSESTGVDLPLMTDVLPPTAAERKEAEAQSTPPSSLRKTFSKRGVRLGVHMSILDLSAHEAPAGLQQKWVQQAQRRQKLGHGQHGDRRLGLTALPELSRISEVDTAAGSTTDLQNLHKPTASEISTFAPDTLDDSPALSLQAFEGNSSNTPKSLMVPCNTPVYARSPGRNRSKSRSSGMGSRVRRMMHRMSFSSLRSPVRSASHERSTGDDDKMKGEDDNDERRPTTVIKSHAEGRDGEEKDNKKEETSKPTFLDALLQRFSRSPLTTPDVEKEFEYNRP